MPRRKQPTALVRAIDTGDICAGLLAGLRACGIAAERAESPEHIRKTRPDIVITWNGCKGRYQAYTRAAQAVAAQLLYVEHGWFQRADYCQLDHLGFNHRAAWGRRLPAPAPAAAHQRLRQILGYEPAPVRARTSGYLLALGQVKGDAQLADSAITSPLVFQQTIARCAPSELPLLYRPHPQMEAYPRLMAMDLPNMPVQLSGDAATYAGTKAGASLPELFAGARAVCAINSNGLHDALLAGLPVAALGPMLALSADAALPISATEPQVALRALAAGWAPDPQAVADYLAWLAGRQWNADELATGHPLATALAAAGWQVPTWPTRPRLMKAAS